MQSSSARKYNITPSTQQYLEPTQANRAINRIPWFVLFAVRVAVLFTSFIVFLEIVRDDDPFLIVVHPVTI